MICLKKTGCLAWNLTDTTNTLEFTASILDINNNIVGSLDDPGGNIVLPSDGIYFVVVVSTVGPNTITNTYVIMDFCNLIFCVQSLLLEIWCKDDVCCENCDEQTASKRRHELNKIMAAFMMLIGLVNAKAVTFYGLACITDAQRLKLDEINNIYSVLKKLIENCGSCKKTKSIGTQSCKSC